MVELCDQPLIFVGGHSRTGTTLMQGLVCRAGPTIGVTREGSYFRALTEAFQLGERWWDHHTHDFFESRADFAAFHRGVCRLWLEQVRARHGDGRIVLKEPRLTGVFPELAALLPGARFVVMVRDFRDVLASQQRRARKGVHVFNPNADLDRFVQTMSRLRAHAGRFTGRLVLVRYEALARSPEPVLHELGAFLDLDLAGGADLSWASKRAAAEESGSALDGAPPSPASIGRYRDTLAPDLLRQIEQLAPQIAAKIGFDCFDDPSDQPPLTVLRAA
jgi:hypothetical protein